MSYQQYPYQPGGYPNYYYPQTSPAFYPYQAQRQMPNQSKQNQNAHGMLPMEQSYIENILRLNRGKHVSVFMTFDGSDKWNSKEFKGVIEAAGRDHIILSDPDSDKRYLLLMIYLNYIVFDEEINYEYPYSNDGFLSNYSPR
ncbi:MAG TPA: spore coat protein GerQ [Bacillota bacterium]|nr:spore coat protein GerQ [Bacillota bacterium]